MIIIFLYLLFFLFLFLFLYIYRLQHEKEAIGNKWTEAQERALELETMKTRDSLSFIAVK